MKRFVFTATMVLCLMLTASAFALEYCRTQTIVVPALCNQFLEHPNAVSYTRLIIHNVDPDKEIRLIRVDFYNPDGDFVESFLDGPVTLDSLESVTYFVRSDESDCCANLDIEGGRPKFIVKWSSTRFVVPPSIRGAVGITGLSGTGSHSETLSEGISIDERCSGF